MRKCSNCNKLCPDSEKFCQTCGLPTTAVEDTSAQQAAPTKKKKTGLIVGIIGAIAALAAAAAIIFIPKRGKLDVMRRFFAAQDEFITNEKLAEKGLTVDSLLSGQYKPEIKNISTDAELKLDLSGLDPNLLDLGELGIPGIDINDKISKLSVFLQLVSGETGSLTGIQLRYNGSSLLSATLDQTENAAGVYIPELSDKRYELSPELLAKLMQQGNEDGSQSGAFDVKFDKVADLKASYEALKKDYLEIFYKGFATEDFTQKEGGARLEGLGDELKGCTEITFVPNAERFPAMIGEMAERIKADKALSDHLLSLMQHYLGESAMKSLLSSCAGGGKLENGERGLLPLFEKLAEKLSSSKEQIAKDITESGFTWRILTVGDEAPAQYIKWNKGEIAAESFGEKDYFNFTENGKTELNVVSSLNKNGEKSDGSITVLLNDKADKVVISVSELEENNKSGLNVPCGKYSIDFSGVTTEKGFENLKLEMNVVRSASGGTDHTLYLYGLNKLAEDAPERIGFTLHTTDTPSALKAPTAETVKVQSEEQLSGIVEELSEPLQEVVTRLLLMLVLG